MKTVSELNAKWWYRLVKVVFIATFLVSAIFAAYATFDTSRTRTVSDYIVKCNYGSKATFAAWQDKGIYISSYSYNGISSLSDSQKEDLQKACGITQDVMNGIFDQIRAGANPKDYALFNIALGKVDVGSNFKAVLYSLLSIMGVYLVFEVARRAFYYVLLGKILPRE
jgi:hypothetical protein